MQDKFGADVTATRPETIAAWNAAMDQYLDFSGSPVGMLDAVDDEAFVMGPVFCAAMRILGGAAPDNPQLGLNLAALHRAAPHGSRAEAAHATAVEFLSMGEFTRAAMQWDAIIAQCPQDVLALKCAHETWFLVGDAALMRASTEAALDRLDPDDPTFAVAAAQHGFALEETGDYAEAESWGRLALDMMPSDCWALHCLAHVYETQNRHVDALALLEAKQPFWQKQNLLNAHIWWHLALRHVETGAHDQVLAIFDEHLSEVSAGDRYRLTDGTSLLWRLELEGVDVGDRWRLMADKWAASAESHTIAFLDLHAALAFARCPDHVAADRFFESLDAAFAGASHENAGIYIDVLRPLAAAIRTFGIDPSATAEKIAPLLPELHRIGGSIVQRELVERSFSSALLAAGQAKAAENWLLPKSRQHPNTPWILRSRAQAAQLRGDLPGATLLNRRADLMFGGFE